MHFGVNNIRRTKIYQNDIMKDRRGKWKTIVVGFPGGAVVGSLPANAGDMGSSPGLGGSHMPRTN